MSFSRMVAKFVSSAAVGTHDLVSEVSPVELPGRRLAFGPAVVVEARGDDILDFLGEDLDERAEQIDELLKRCTQDELDQIFAALAEAMKVRAARGDTELGGSRNGDRSRREEERARRRQRRRAA